MKDDVVSIVGMARTPLCSFMGDLSNLTAPEIGSFAIKGAFAEASIPPETIDQVIMGCVLSAGIGQAPARQALLKAGISKNAGAITLNKMCGSGMQAVMLAHDSILAGSHKCVIAGGMESMTNAPYLLSNARNGLKMGDHLMNDSMMLDGLVDAYSGKAMGFYADITASKHNISREAQDHYTIQAIDRALAAQCNGDFEREIVPIDIPGQEIIKTDQELSKVMKEKIPQLKPVFRANGTITAANASSINDGAAALLLMPSSLAVKNNQKILANIVCHSCYANDPENFATAPIGAIRKVLNLAGWRKKDVDLWEINEAFSVVPLVAMKALSIDRDHLNVNGGASVLGHPIGASGARIIVSLLAALEKNNLRRGVASVCIGGGEATAICIERQCAD